MIGHYSNIGNARKAAGLTAQQVAEQAGIGLSTYLRMERGEMNCHADAAESIAEILRADPADFNPSIPRRPVILHLVQS